MSDSMKLLGARMGVRLEEYVCEQAHGDDPRRVSGFAQQERMIRDKRKTLDRAVLHSYQGAIVKKIYDPLNDSDDLLDDGTERYCYRALINSNKLKPDYDDKILSVGFEAGYKCGDVLEWMDTGTSWLIYDQNLTERAYFRGDIRRCDYIIKWKDDSGNLKSTYAAIRGPVETRINSWQKNGVEYNSPNYSLNIVIPKNETTIKYFQRYAKFYLSNGLDYICWRVEAVDSFRLEGVIEFTAVEYYANPMTDDVVNGIVNNTNVVEDAAPVGELLNPRLVTAAATTGVIVGESNIKAKRTYTYFFSGQVDEGDAWYNDCKGPIITKEIHDEQGKPGLQLKWNQTYGDTFKIWFGDKSNSKRCEKTITVKSLF